MRYNLTAFATVATLLAFATPALAARSPAHTKAVVPVALAHTDGIHPDPVYTPGAVRTHDRNKIVTVNTKTVRNVSDKLKLRVYRRYGMTGPNGTIPGTSHQKPFEVDHRIPLCAGGANAIGNLWIQASDGDWTFHQKDLLEDRVCRKLKKGVITVAQAQAVFYGDWTEAYLKEFGVHPAD